jgi:hypothetical protein
MFSSVLTSLLASLNNKFQKAAVGVNDPRGKGNQKSGPFKTFLQKVLKNHTVIKIKFEQGPVVNLNTLEKWGANVQ